MKEININYGYCYGKDIITQFYYPASKQVSFYNTPENEYDNLQSEFLVAVWRIKTRVNNPILKSADIAHCINTDAFTFNLN